MKVNVKWIYIAPSRENSKALRHVKVRDRIAIEALHVTTRHEEARDKRIKSYLRSSMGDQRLTNLCLLSIEPGLSSEIIKSFMVQS